MRAVRVERPCNMTLSGRLASNVSLLEHSGRYTPSSPGRCAGARRLLADMAPHADIMGGVIVQNYPSERIIITTLIIMVLLPTSQ